MNFYYPNGTLSGRSFSEIWDGTRWVHSDTTGSSSTDFDNPRHYVDEEGSTVSLMAVVTNRCRRFNFNIDGADDDDILSQEDYTCIYSQDVMNRYA